MEDKLSAFQQLLSEAYLNYQRTKKARKVSDNQFARWLGVNPGSFNQWITGNRLPSYQNAVILAERLGDVVYDVLGYDKPGMHSNAADLRYIAEHGGMIDDETRATIYAHVKEIVEGRKDGNDK